MGEPNCLHKLTIEKGKVNDNSQVLPMWIFTVWSSQIFCSQNRIENKKNRCNVPNLKYLNFNLKSDLNSFLQYERVLWKCVFSNINRETRQRNKYNNIVFRCGGTDRVGWVRCKGKQNRRNMQGKIDEGRRFEHGF